MGEYRDDALPGSGGDREIGEVGDDGLDLNAALSGETLGFGKANDGLINGGHGEAVFGEEDGVSPLAFS